MSQLLNLDVPAAVRTVCLATERGPFAAYDVTPRDGEPAWATALLVPGFMGSKEDFLPLLTGLSAAGVRVVAIDGRGQNETGPASSAPSYTRKALAADLLAVARHLDVGPVHLVGHSCGGIPVREAVLAMEDHPGVWASLGLLNVGPGSVASWQQERLELLLSVIDTMTLEELWPYVAGAQGDVSDEVGRFLRERWLRNDPRQLRASAQQMLTETDRTDQLARLALPMTVVSGTPDATWPPEEVAHMAQRLSARYTRIEGGGHSPNVHRPRETTVALVAFWSDCSR